MKPAFFAFLPLAAATVLCGFILITSATPDVESVFDGTACNGARPSFFNVVPAVNYDCGGQGLGYNVTNPGNPGVGGSYRPDHVNFENNASFTPPFDLGFNVQNVSYNYLVNFPQPGPYTITMTLGAPAGGGSWNVFLDGGATPVTSITTPNTGSYQTYQPSTSSQFTATQGDHKLTFAWGAGNTQDGGAGNFANWQGAQVQSGGIACAVGPNYMGPVPAGAAAAGYNTCAANYDFTSPQFSNINTWLACKGAAAPLMYMGQPDQCNYVTIENDGGVQVAHLTYPPNGSNSGNTSLQSTPNLGGDSGQGLTFPLGLYADVVARKAPNQNTSYLADVFFFGYGPPSGIGSKGVVEQDVVEMFNNDNASNGVVTAAITSECPVNGGNNSCFIAGWGHNGVSALQYFNYGLRVTTDSSGHLAACDYENDVIFGQCNPFFNGGVVRINTTSDANSFGAQFNRNPLIIEAGQGECCTARIDFYLQRVTIFTCSNWFNSDHNNDFANNGAHQCWNAPILLSGP